MSGGVSGNYGNSNNTNIYDQGSGSNDDNSGADDAAAAAAGGQALVDSVGDAALKLSAMVDDFSENDAVGNVATAANAPAAGIDSGEIANVGEMQASQESTGFEDVLVYTAVQDAISAADSALGLSTDGSDAASNVSGTDGTDQVDLNSLTPEERTAAINYLSGQMSDATAINQDAIGQAVTALKSAQSDGQNNGGVITDTTASALGNATAGLVAAGVSETATVGAMQAVLDSGETADPDGDAATVAAAVDQANSDLSDLNSTASTISTVVEGSNAVATDSSGPTYSVTSTYSGMALFSVMAAMIKNNSVTSTTAQSQNDASSLYQDYVSALSSYANQLINAESGLVNQMGVYGSGELASSQMGGWWDDLPLQFGMYAEMADGSKAAPDYSGLLTYCQSMLTQQGSVISLVNSNISNVSNTIDELDSSASNSASAVQTVTSLAMSIAQNVGSQLTDATTLSS